jgi:hypothetical protein
MKSNRLKAGGFNLEYGNDYKVRRCRMFRELFSTAQAAVIYGIMQQVRLDVGEMTGNGIPCAAICQLSNTIRVAAPDLIRGLNSTRLPSASPASRHP